MTDKEKQPIIIKKVTVQAAGHHGGAWKVAYADFVTAMMAFFLLLWLLNSIPADKLEGIAQYFEPTIGLAGKQGIGFQGGLATQTTEGTQSADKAQGVKYGVIRSGELLDVPEVGTEIDIEEIENERFALVEGELNKVIKKDPTLKSLQNSITFKQTPEGLSISINDQDKYPMFKPGSAELTTFTKNVLFRITKLIQHVPNLISISGHTDKYIETNNNTTYTNWELSADRANAARRYVIDSGISPEQIGRIVARADSSLFDPANPYSAKNRRIEIVLLRNSIMPFHNISAPKSLLNSPSREDFDFLLKGN